MKGFVMIKYRVLFFLFFISIIAISNTIAEMVYVTGKIVNVRSGPGIQHKVAGKVRKDDELERIENLKDWSKVILPDGETGWIHDQYISIRKPPTMPKKVYVAGVTVNVRSGPGTKFKKIAQVKKNDELAPIKNLDGWTRVLLPNGETGWINDKYILKSKENGKEKDEDKKIHAHSKPVLQFRSFKLGSPKAEIIQELEKEGYAFILENEEIHTSLKELFGHACDIGFYFTPKSLKLYMIELLWPKIDISERARRILVYKYGLPYGREDRTDDLIWVSGDVSVKLEANVEETIIYYIHSKLAEGHENEKL